MRFPKPLQTGVALLAVAASLAGVTACGAGSKTGGESAATVACDYPMPAQSTTVNVLAYNSSAIDPFTNTMVKSCTRDKVTLKHDPIDFAGQVTKTTATLAGATGSYDVLETYGFVVPGLAEHGDIEPLDDYVAKYADKYKLNALSKEMRESMSYNGKLYGLPMQAQMYVMAYRKDVFDAAGIKPPTTFAEMIDAAKKIQAQGTIKYPIALPWNATADITTNFQAAMNSYGKDFLDSSGKPQFASPESGKALEQMKALLPYMDPQVTTFDQPKVQQQMFNGTAAMAIMFSGRMNDLTLPANTKLASNFAFAAPPAVEAGAPYLYSRLSVDGWSIPKNTKLDKDMLFQMMASSVGEEASKASVPAAYPAREGMVSEDSSKYAAAANGTIGKTMPAAGDPNAAPVTNAIRPILVQVITGQLDVQAGMQQMQSIAEKTISGS
ncbi:sorbitol/mannitol transport system substrate-binding protein [Arthrobacter sp. 1088]|uniref:ABC transporter substrate-binding protein n=1 Tax=Arthrobacter sp. 1088 TaxID=2817768 RepID=UPI0028650C7C|nr:extracellular solute-binding protein [Arthrobacter sp. 1088]MDR6687722.1 sorbitol/mannitol transport system substrate-binding protein [Arthrobacter sp. 1088]